MTKAEWRRRACGSVRFPYAASARFQTFRRRAGPTAVGGGDIREGALDIQSPPMRGCHSGGSPALSKPSTNRGIFESIDVNDFIEVMLGLRRMVSASSVRASLSWPDSAYAAAKTSWGQ